MLLLLDLVVVVYKRRPVMRPGDVVSAIIMSWSSHCLISWGNDLYFQKIQKIKKLLRTGINQQKWQQKEKNESSVGIMEGHISWCTTAMAIKIEASERSLKYDVIQAKS